MRIVLIKQILGITFHNHNENSMDDMNWSNRNYKRGVGP